MSSLENSMSSGSRIRQFGLYRTIDARTEEFLRLSRKRQIRQGCACAAASTAITVTIVIVMFFVYQFSLNSNTQLQKSLKYNWLSLINNTEDESSFDPKLTKTNIDLTTLKLLPILMKAIKKNAALEKLFDDQSSLLSQNDERNSKTDDSNYEQTKHTADWLKKTTTQLLAVDHKTLPVLFYKDPTKNIELYSKIRKIRDYQRVFKYVDKMINEKVHVRSTRPMPPEMSYRALDTQRTTIKTNIKQVNNITNKNINNATQDTKHTCKCTHSLKELMNKILLNFEKSLPKVKQDHQKTTHFKCQKYMKRFLITPKSKVKSINTHLLPHYSSEQLVHTVVTPPRKTNRFESDELEIEDLETNDMSYLLKQNNSINTHSKYKDVHDIKTTTYTKPIKPITIDKFDKMINEKQILKRHKILKPSTKLQPIFDGIEYNDYDSYTTPSLKKSALINFVKTKLNYLRHVNGENKTNKKNTVTSLKNIFDADMTVVDNKITLVKTKQKVNNKEINGDIGIKNNDETDFFEINVTTPSSLNKNITSSLPSVDAEKQIISHLLNATNFPELFTPKSAYFKYYTSSQEDKTVYNMLKNSINTYLTNQSLKLNPTTSSNDGKKQKIIQSSRNNFNPLHSDKKIKSATYHIIENNVKSLLNKNITTLKAMKQKYIAKLQSLKDKSENFLITKKDNIIDIIESTTTKNGLVFTTTESDENETDKNREISSKIYKTSFEAIPVTKPPEPSKRTNSTNVSDNDLYTETAFPLTSDKEYRSPPNHVNEEEFLITEITKSPENAIYQARSNITEKQKNSDLTWEDLTNEFMPAWRSMIQDPNKPIYFGHQKAEDKSEEQEDYNINSNFYDLII